MHLVDAHTESSATFVCSLAVHVTGHNRNVPVGNVKYAPFGRTQGDFTLHSVTKPTDIKMHAAASICTLQLTQGARAAASNRGASGAVERCTLVAPAAQRGESCRVCKRSGSRSGSQRPKNQATRRRRRNAPRTRHNNNPLGSVPPPSSRQGVQVSGNRRGVTGCRQVRCHLAGNFGASQPGHRWQRTIHPSTKRLRPMRRFFAC